MSIKAMSWDKNGDSLEMVSEGLKHLRKELTDTGMIDKTISDYGAIQCAAWLVRVYSNTAGFPIGEFDAECQDGLNRPPPLPPPLTYEEQIEIWRADMGSYYKSGYWRKVRKEALVCNDICSHCGSENNLVVHHIDYKNIGVEMMHNLMTLCRSCHTTLHRKGTKS